MDMIIKTLFYCGASCALLYTLVFSTGCAGVELGGKMGLYAVDQREETQVTKSRAKPLKCLWSQAEGC